MPPFQTPKLTSWNTKLGIRVDVHKQFLKNWFWVDDVKVVMSQPNFLNNDVIFAMTVQAVQIGYIDLLFKADS